MTLLQGHDWPGNVWELANVVERLLLLVNEDGDTAVRGENVTVALGEVGRESMAWDGAGDVMNQPLREAREAFEREYLLFHLTRFSGNISRTAEFVGMDRAALHRKIKGLGIQNTLKAQQA